MYVTLDTLRFPIGGGVDLIVDKYHTSENCKL